MDKLVDRQVTAREGKAVIESVYSWGQEVWFIHNRRMHHGKVVGIRGEQGFYSRDTELLVSCTYGELGMDEWVSELDCYSSLDLLIKSL